MNKLKLTFMIVLCAAMLASMAGCGEKDGVIAGNRDDSLYSENVSGNGEGSVEETDGGAYYDGKFYSDTEYNYEEKTLRYLDKTDIPAMYTKAEDGEQLEPPKAGDKVAEFITNYGTFKVRLFEEQAPVTVANFVALAEQNYYDGMIFHRVINNFMIQGGDPTATGYYGESIYGEDFEDEYGRNLYNFRGALSMANSGSNTNGSQFFIVQTADAGADAETLKSYGWPQWAAEKYVELGGTPHLDGGLSPQGYAHTVFGQVYEGMDVIDAIAAVETDSSDKPVKNVYIYDIIISIYEG